MAQQSAGQYVTTVAQRVDVALDIRAIFNTPDLDEAKHLQEKLTVRYEKKIQKLAQWAEKNLPEGFTVYALPAAHRRRARAARLFPNEASCLRLVTAVLMEIAEDWQTAEERYLSFDD